jgi:hypothetical protein
VGNGAADVAGAADAEKQDTQKAEHQPEHIEEEKEIADSKHVDISLPADMKSVYRQSKGPVSSIDTFLHAHRQRGKRIGTALPLAVEVL